MVKVGVLLGIGNPLLDISAHVDSNFLSKYGLKPDNAILYEKEDIFIDLKEHYPVQNIPGGATQNSIRIAQAMIGEPGACSYIGCIGNDESATIMKNISTDLGINTNYQMDQNYPTGKCAVLITGASRSLVTKLDAAKNFSVSHLDEQASMNLLKQADVVYSAGFFLTVSVDTMLKAAKYVSQFDEKKFCMNLSAPFLCEIFSEQMMSVMPYCDILFGNETEAVAFSTQQKFGLGVSQLLEISIKIAELPKKRPERPRVVIITQGSDSVIVCQNGKTTLFDVPAIKHELLVDTNGAGDAFVGGFLARLVDGKSIAECVKDGIWAASLIIQSSGCTFPSEE